MGAGDTTARDLAADAGDDLYFERGDLVLVAGADGILSEIKARLQTWRGEWFLDKSIGVPYLETILVKNPNFSAVRAVFRSELLATAGVTRVAKLDLTFDGPSRALSVSFEVETDTGELLADSVEVA